MATLEIDSQDVVKLILQFLKENGLNDSFHTLQKESDVALNVVESVKTFVHDIEQGKWEAVLEQVMTFRLPTPKLFALYDQVVVELIELRELDTARLLLSNADIFVAMKEEKPQRFSVLQQLLTLGVFDSRLAYPDGSTKERKRSEIASTFAQEVTVAAPSKLLCLLQDGVKWRKSKGSIPKTEKFDLFHGVATKKEDMEEDCPRRQFGRIKFADKSHAECGFFSPDGVSLVTGSVDGFVEVWDFETCKLRLDLQYQADEQFMMHPEPVLCVGFSKNSDMIATGSKDGMIKVWKMDSGKCLRRFKNAHSRGVTCLCFNSGGTNVLSGSFDTTLRVHGLRSGKILREFAEHSSFINSVCYSSDGRFVVSGSSDGFVKIWNAKTAVCLHTLSPPRPMITPGAVDGDDMVKDLRDNVVHFAFPIPKRPGTVLVGTRSNMLYVMTYSGDVLARLSSGKVGKGCCFVTGCISPKGKWAYAIDEEGSMYCFSLQSERLEMVIKAHKGVEVVGMAHHPDRNVVVTFAADGEVKLWTS